MSYSPDQEITWHGDGGIVCSVGPDDVLIKGEPGPCPVDKDCAAEKCGGRILHHADVVFVSKHDDSALALALYRCPKWTGPERPTRTRKR